MKNLLSKSQREAVDLQFANLLIYQTIKKPCWEISKEYLPHLKLRSEDVLYEYFNKLDWIRDEQDNNIELQIENIWEIIYDDIDYLSNAPESEKVIATALITTVLLITLQTLNDIPLCNSISLRLANIIMDNAEDYWDLLHQKLLYSFQIWGVDNIAKELREYVTSDACYSFEIEEICNTIENSTTSFNDKLSTLTIAQTAILLIEGLDIYLEHTNAKALGDLINAITGKTRGRVAVEEIKTKGYCGKDALIVADYLAKIKPDLAEKIKNGAVD